MPKSAPHRLTHIKGSGSRRYQVVGSKPLAKILYNTFTKGAITHHNTTEDLSRVYHIKDEIEIKNEPPRENYEQSPIVSSEYVDPRFTKSAEMYEEESFSPSYSEQAQVPSNITSYTYQDGGGQVYEPSKYMQVGNVVVQVLEPGTQYFLVNSRHVPADSPIIQEQAVIKEVARRKTGKTRTFACAPKQSQHWADVYVEEEEANVQVQEEQTSDDPNKFIIGQDENEVNVHIITKDGKETTTIINTYREVEQQPNKEHGENGHCGCKIREGKKNKSYVDAFQQFISEMNSKKSEVATPCANVNVKKEKKVKIEH